VTPVRAPIAIAVACLALAGCKRSTGAPSCEQVAAHVQSVAQTAASDGKGGGPMHQLVRERCTTDRWSAKARTCMRGITGLGGIASCRDALTPEQANTLAAAAAFAMQQIEPRKGRDRPSDVPPGEPQWLGPALKFRVGATGVRSADGAAISVDDVEHAVRTAVAHAPQTRVVIAAEPDVPHAKAVELVERVRQAGAVNVGLGDVAPAP
jgi:hypothetical protein